MVDSQDLQLAASVDYTSVIKLIIYLVLIIIGAYYLTKYVAKRSLRRGMKKDSSGSKWSASSQPKTKSGPEFGHLVSVADRIAIDRDKTLMVVEFEGRYYLIGTTQDGFQIIDHVKIKHAEQTEQESQPIADPGVARPDDESTFGKRFQKAFGIVLRSYLPKGMRDKAAPQPSFDEQLKARIHADDDVPMQTEATSEDDVESKSS